MPRHLLSHHVSRGKKVFPITKDTSKDDTKNQGNDNSWRRPRIRRSTPGHSKDNKPKAENEQKLATEIDGFKSCYELGPSSSFSCLVKLGNRLGAEELLAQDKEGDDEGENSDR